MSDNNQDYEQVLESDKESVKQIETHNEGLKDNRN